MIRKVFIMLSLLFVTIYLIAAFSFLNKKAEGKTCSAVEISIMDSVNTGFIHSNEIVSLLKQKKLYPKGKELQYILCKDIETVLQSNPLIERAECYKTPLNKVCIQIYQRIPVIRIMSSNGQDYYIDSKGKIMPNVPCPAHLPIATGAVTQGYAEKHLVSFAHYIQSDEFWNDQIEQINITPAQEIELVPRVGDHIIFLGKPTLLTKKLARLKEFYQKGLNVVGWNRYSRISLEFNNQVICTKKEK